MLRVVKGIYSGVIYLFCTRPLYANGYKEKLSGIGERLLTEICRLQSSTKDFPNEFFVVYWLKNSHFYFINLWADDQAHVL
jgi:hypothetical protein